VNTATISGDVTFKLEREKGRDFPSTKTVFPCIVEMCCVQDYCFITLRDLFHVEYQHTLYRKKGEPHAKSGHV
jgi:hypothetical protein